MIPVCLNLRNFMSYTDVHEPLRFEGVHVAVLAGDNGHGKSALLDAITWALWGKARGRSVDELIHTGATEMEVEFEFILDEHQYRVIRKRQRRGKSGMSDLQFAVLSDGGYRPLTERSLSETERSIERTLRMSYETFINSSFIQQGRADSFTTNSATERKRILGEILELGYYDELEARAKDAYREREALLGDERRRAQEWELEIARRPLYQAEVDRTKAEMAALETQVAELEQACNTARERVARLDALRRQVEEIDERLQRFAADRERGQQALDERRAQLTLANKVLGRAADVERAAAELHALRGQLEKLDRMQQEFLPLERSRLAARGQLLAEQARLEGDVSARDRQIAPLRELAARMSDADREYGEAADAARLVGELHVEFQRLQADIATQREEAAEKRTINAQLKQGMLDMRARMAELESMSTCPTCDRPMDRQHRDRLVKTYEAQGLQLRDQFRAQEGECRALEASVKAGQTQLSEMTRLLDARESIQRRLAVAESALEQAREAQRQVGTLQAELDERRGILDNGRFAVGARRTLRDLEARIAAIGYDEEAHAATRERVLALADVDREMRLLERARAAAEHLTSQVAELEASIARLDEECSAENARKTELRTECDPLEAERARLGTLDEQLRQAQVKHGHLRDLYLQATSRLDNCAFLERKRNESLVRQDALRREQGLYSELAHAFGRRGVQAMIIETAIPEIEDESNRLLSRMTDGRMHVSFETQRDARHGGGTIETLDIKIGDELGTRNYEMFSGGESFRVNFAIRIALSRLLATRAGTRLQTLVVDEGFGSQDQEGRDRMVDAIQTIQDEFEKVLVITHLEDLRERFPVRIDVLKTPRGSTYTLR